MAKTIKPKKTEDENIDNSPDYITFVVHTAKYRTLANKKYQNRKKWIPNDIRQIVADIPGGVHKIYVKPGSKVEKGDLLLELEAMKMYNKILSPIDGVVKAVLVEEKIKVGKNQLLIELEDE